MGLIMDVVPIWVFERRDRVVAWAAAWPSWKLGDTKPVDGDPYSILDFGLLTLARINRKIENRFVHSIGSVPALVTAIVGRVDAL